MLVEQDVWVQFRPAVESVGDRWLAPSGRTYRLAFDGLRLEIYLVLDEGLDPPPGGDEIDADLFALTCQLYDAVGGEWSSEALRQTAQLWGWTP